MTAIKRIFTILILSLAAAGAGSIANAKTTDSKESIRQQLVGTWQLKQTTSNFGTKKEKSSLNETAPVSTAIPKSLVLAADEEFGEITINEAFEKVIHTQTLPINKDAAIGEKKDNGAIVKAFWDNKKLIIEAVASNGVKMTETFEMGANKNQLKVTMKLNDAKKSKAIITRRVYDRAADQSDAESTAEINVSQFLL